MSKLKEWAKDIRAYYYFRKNCKRKSRIIKVMNVAFLVHTPQLWDKLEPVYELLVSLENVNVDLIVVPSYSDGFNVVHDYGNELRFFKSKYKNVKKAISDDGKVIDISDSGYDYVFYQTPYNAHYPIELNSCNVAKYSKICYIPYGFSGSNAFNDGNTNVDFFRYVFFWFGDVTEVRDILCKRFKYTVSAGLQRFLLLGYPAFERYDVSSMSNKKKLRILWTPRWVYHPVIGGSHFMEYKDRFVELSQIYKEHSFAIRPHPMMFTNFINENRITNKDKEEYIKKLEKNNIFLSESRKVNEDFDDADILITDYSSVIPMFFLTGKPIIYCESHIAFNNIYKELAKGMYMANSWEDVKAYIDNLIRDCDFLKDDRSLIIKAFKQKHKGATKRIVETMLQDYRNFVKE